MRLANVMAALAFVFWGLTPLYYQFLAQPAMDELLALRIIASVPLCALVALILTRVKPRLSAILADRRSLLFSVTGAVIINASSYIFIWAVVNHQTSDASLGYFISPLLFAVIGLILTRDRLSSGMVVSLLLGLGGVLFLTLDYGHIPYVALGLAVLFISYSWCKKSISYEWPTALLVEALAMLPIALGYMVYKSQTVGSEAFSHGFAELALYVGAAPVTLLPLLFYSLAVRRAKMTTIGVMQYIEPSLQFLIATYVLGESFSNVKMISFGMIWLGLVFIIAEQMIRRYPALSALNLSSYESSGAHLGLPTVAMMREQSAMVKH